MITRLLLTFINTYDRADHISDRKRRLRLWRIQLPTNEPPIQQEQRKRYQFDTSTQSHIFIPKLLNVVQKTAAAFFSTSTLPK